MYYPLPQPNHEPIVAKGLRFYTFFMQTAADLAYQVVQAQSQSAAKRAKTKSTSQPKAANVGSASLG
jgi:hypothetical protein